MVLPIYVALERIDPRVVEAAHDLYATRCHAFRQVVLPLSLPGVFAGVLMTFVPVSADYVNAQVLGGTRQHDDRQRHPDRSTWSTTTTRPPSALSFMLMAILLIGIFATPGRWAPRTCWRWRPDERTAHQTADSDRARAASRRPAISSWRKASVATPGPSWSGCSCRSRCMIAVQLQRHQRPLQHHLAGLHAQVVRQAVRLPGPHQALFNTRSIGAAHHAHRRRRSAPCSASRWAATGSAGSGATQPGDVRRDLRRPSSSWARRCCRCSSRSTWPLRLRPRRSSRTSCSRISFVAITVRARVLDPGPAASRRPRATSARTRWTTFRLVTFPMIFPASWRAACWRSRCRSTTSSSPASPAATTATFPLWIWGATRVGMPPQVNVMGTLIFVVGVLIAITNIILARRRS